MKITMGFSENVVEEKPIYIHFYAIENENEPIYHQVEQGVDSNLKKITFEGSLMGYYYPRWFPEMIPLLLNDMRTDYYVQSENLDVEIVLEKKIESGLGDDRVTINFANKTVTSVSGDMDGALFHTDIFRCGTDTYVIRLK